VSPPDYLAEVPTPVLFNSWKHHARAVRQRIAQAVGLGAVGMSELAGKLTAIGTGLMDLYTGVLTPTVIAERLLAQLDQPLVHDAAAYREWIRMADGYRLLIVPDDSSRWVLRVGDDPGRHVHVHPGRWTAATIRVRANIHKTAILTVADATLAGGDPYDVSRINRIRREHLGLAPISGLTGEQGLRRVIELLASGA
jgi:hypothetical protein